MLSHNGLYAYGLVSKKTEHLDILGIDNQNKVYPVSENDMCVMVSKVDIDAFQNRIKNLVSELTSGKDAVQQGAAELLQAHEQVIDTLMQDATVIPFKFGTILKDEKAASQMLQDQKENFQSLLAKFTGKVEWGVKVYVNKQALTKHLMQNEPKFISLQEKRANLSRGAAYLFDKKMEVEVKNAVATQLAQITERIFHELERNAFEAKLNNILPQKMTGKKQEMILNAAYLIERGREALFRQQGIQFVEEYGPLELELEFSGPWPPYNFT
ncbi:gas vesicle protein [Ktedonobacter sp. SOSP1-52]|uniref:GvpL/GvpF family gas vesicle protein n=1 Tax=Ktedonobacter sp. SOSP1-52 TaxID=2778366 RepID=UPI001915213A|nr:GvpL/GvpF family gas vesicle protein [Ktedonobacter sp. SOSP1-52]GHO70897.1 gas vesicle protein [Ktedonobacter sp. SOSP1-52]